MEHVKYQKWIEIQQKTGKWDLRGWEGSFGPLQVNFIVQQFKQYFSCPTVLNGVRRWPSSLASQAMEECKSLFHGLSGAGEMHGQKREKVLSALVNLLVQIKGNDEFSSPSPLQKLEAKYRKRTFRFRFLRKYFSCLLPPRNRNASNNKRKKNKKKNLKRFLKREQARAIATASTGEQRPVDVVAVNEADTAHSAT